MSTPVLLWFRQDLRLADQAAVVHAAAAGPVVPVYVLDDETPGDWRTGAAARWWLHHSLASLDASLRARGARLLLLRGAAATCLAELAEAVGARVVHALRHYEPWAKAQEQRVAARLTLRLHDGVTASPPAAIRTIDGGRYRIFTPFWHRLHEAMAAAPPPLAAPDRLVMAVNAPAGEPLDALGLCPSQPNWAAGWDDLWQPGEAGARRRLDAFLAAAGASYDDGRDIPGIDGTSRLSPHLHHGELSAGVAWRGATAALGPKALPFLRQLGWRDFSIGLVDQFPDMHQRPLRPAYARFPHADPAEEGTAAAWRAWTRGETGYPIVDAGMRQLWATGWMHNRVRMIVASFLVKHLLIDWRLGERWFWDTLVDADLGNNATSWQWIMGSGVDSAPFSRIFAPVAQGRKLDPDGAYVKRWVPALRALPAVHLHAPWEAPPLAREAAGLRLGVDYPWPIVDHGAARARALDAYRAARAGEAVTPLVSG